MLPNGVRTQPHPGALFSLIPHNDSPGAKAVIEHNYHLVSAIPGCQNPANPNQIMYGINVGFYIGNKSSCTLASIGRDADILTPVPMSQDAWKWRKVARIQCSFEVNPQSKEVLLYDRSTIGTTCFIGDNIRPFELGRLPRRVLTQPDFNNHFEFPGDVQFKIFWHDQKIDVGMQITYREDNPRLTRTADDEPTVPSTCRVTRIHTPASGRPKIRYLEGKRLGEGTFGEVSRVIDVDSGEHMALKKIPWPRGGPLDPKYRYLKREVETMALLFHPKIVEFIGSQGLEVPEQHLAPSGDSRPCLELFMGLKDGNIKRLMHSNAFENDSDLSRRLLHDGLKGLDYLESKNVLHRDVKPENILWTKRNGGIEFQFTDFGLCNLISMAVSTCGTKKYMAPEVLYGTGNQTPKIDVWSFFVTLAEVLNANGYREMTINTDADIIPAIQKAAEAEQFQALRPMAVLEPRERATAGYMLDRLFNGEGRTTA
ncbi:MAG: hypothetical protein Q9225_001374 [Loekoesia sp. 1 TL-2023]